MSFKGIDFMPWTQYQTDFWGRVATYSETMHLLNTMSGVWENLITIDLHKFFYHALKNIQEFSIAEKYGIKGTWHGWFWYM